MSQKIVDFYNLTPLELENGNVFVSTVTCHISYIDDEADTVYIKVYRCAYPPQLGYESNIPQGDHMGNDIEIAKTLYPILNNFAHIKVL